VGGSAHLRDSKSIPNYDVERHGSNPLRNRKGGINQGNRTVGFGRRGSPRDGGEGRGREGPVLRVIAVEVGQGVVEIAAVLDLELPV
jgi:hypothetical protein